jgi:hypothetical protein
MGSNLIRWCCGLLVTVIFHCPINPDSRTQGDGTSSTARRLNVAASAADAEVVSLIPKNTIETG